MQRPDSPLNKLFDAARQEHSTLSEEDVRALLKEPKKPNRSPIMIPMLIAGVIITIAGMTTSVVMNQTDPTLSKAATTSTKRTPEKLSTSSTSTRENTTTVDQGEQPVEQDARQTKIVVRTDRDGATNESTMVFFSNGSDMTSPGLCRVKSIFPSSSNSDDDAPPQVFFATVSANREVTTRLSNTSAPVPVLCTDSRGRACSSTDVAFFPANYQAIAGNLNNLVPVTYDGREDILVWYTPSPALVEAFPDSLQDDLETLLDIDIDIEIDGGVMMEIPEMPDMPEMPEIRIEQLKMARPALRQLKMPSAPFNSQSIDSLVASVQKQLGCGEPSGTKPDVKTFLFNDSLLKSFKFNDSTFATFKSALNAYMHGTDSSMHAALGIDMNTMDSSMKTLQLHLYGFDSTMKNFDFDMKQMDSSMMQQYMQLDTLRLPNKNIFKFKKRILSDTSMRNGTSNGKQRVRSRVIIKSNVKRNKNGQAPIQLEKLSELTPTSNGAIASTSVYPNPATEGGATMSYVLSEPRALTLQLLDLNGNIVATMMQDAKRTTGNGQFAFTLNNIPSGMYLVNLSTDKGERAIQRLIVQ